jgi:hypothetical protein
MLRHGHRAMIASGLTCRSLCAESIQGVRKQSGYAGRKLKLALQPVTTSNRE